MYTLYIALAKSLFHIFIIGHADDGVVKWCTLVCLVYNSMGTDELDSCTFDLDFTLWKNSAIQQPMGYISLPAAVCYIFHCIFVSSFESYVSKTLTFLVGGNP